MRSAHEKKGSSSSSSSRNMGKLLNKSASFHLPIQGDGSRTSSLLRRPKTDPNLLSFPKIMMINKMSSSPPSEAQLITPAKLLLNVSIQRSLGTVRVVMSQESTVGDLISAVVQRYIKEERRPFLATTDPSCFNLHYSQFSFESLDRMERLTELGSRNFFLCLDDTATYSATSCNGSSSVTRTTTTSSSLSRASCSSQVVEIMAPNITIDLPWLSFVTLFDQDFINLCR